MGIHIYSILFHLEDKDAVKGYFAEIKKLSAKLDGNYRELARRPEQKLLILYFYRIHIK